MRAASFEGGDFHGLDQNNGHRISWYRSSFIVRARRDVAIFGCGATNAATSLGRLQGPIWQEGRQSNREQGWLGDLQVVGATNTATSFGRLQGQIWQESHQC